METRHCGEVASKIRPLKDLSGRKVKNQGGGRNGRKIREEGEKYGKYRETRNLTARSSPLFKRFVRLLPFASTAKLLSFA